MHSLNRNVWKSGVMKMLSTHLKGGVLAFGLVLSASSLSHTPYLVPSAFEPVNGGLITLDASFAERFFVPEVVFDGSEFDVRLPSGVVIEPNTVINLQSRNVVEHDLVDDGTYRFSTGRRLGRVFRIYEQDGERIAIENPDDPVPDGVELVDWYQSNTMAETYVSRGAPSDGALSPRGDGLEFQPVTHPNDLFVGEALELITVYYGEPVSGVQVEVFLAARQFSEETPVAIVESDANGFASFTPELEGIYLLRSRHRDKAPDGADAPEYSHTYTLVVEAFE